MAFTTVKATNIAEGAITTEKISVSVSLGVKISNVAIANSTYTVLDDTAVNVGGGYIVITGSGFSDGAQVLIDQTPATSVTVVNSTTIRAQVPSANAASYNLYVVNSDGSTGIRVNGLTYSGTPTWVTGSTLDNQAVDVAFNVGLNATGAVSYANTSELPAGTALLSNGYFYGTVTGIAEETVYNFTVVATDAENQDSPRTFSVTVTVGPPPTTLYAWGKNSIGGLGLNDSNAKSSPIQVGSDTNWNLISCGYYNTLTTKTDGTLWSFGFNNFGQLGFNDAIDRSSPTQVGSGTNWDKISAGIYSSIATKTDGTLWIWGYNNRGQLGIGDRVNKSSPTQVGTDTNWNNISFGNRWAVATKTDGTLWTWGYNNNGQLGLGDVIYRSSPTQVGTGTTWDKVNTLEYHAAATKTDGTLWTWGYNNNGQLGLGDVIYRSSPVQVGTGTTWDKVDAGKFNIAAIKTDGTLWTWGNNSYGQLGLGDVINRSSPTQVGSGTTWNLVSIGIYNTITTKTDGTLWTWGRDSNGQLGLGDIGFNKSSPVQIGSDTNWDKVSTQESSVIATKTV